MADIESLEKLSNNEIRLKCIEYGLPNVPVTDSSRKLLIKRLRDAINNMPAKETTITTKTSSRRETIQITKEVPIELPSVPKSRRTIAAAAIATNVVPSKEDNSAPAVAPTTAIPIATRRRSTQKEANEPTKPTKSNLKSMQTIVIEDDEDVDLLSAVENAEKQSTTSSVPIENIPARRKSRSVSVPKGTVDTITNVAAAPKKRAMTPLVEEQTEKIKATEPKSVPTKKQLPKSAVNISAVQSSAVPPVQTQMYTQTLPQYSQSSSKTNVEIINRYSTQNTTPSVYSTPSAYASRYSFGAGASALGGSLPTYRPKYTAETLLNELSDTEVKNDDGTQSPYLSGFVRDLERRKSVGRTTGASSASRLVRRSGGSTYENIHGRRASRDVTDAGDMLVRLSKQSHFKVIFLSLSVLSLLIFGFLYFKS